MIITKTPFRISFFGGGSDLEDFYSKEPGAVLSVSINKFMYISTHRFFDENQVRLKYSQTETVSRISELKHPIVKEVLARFDNSKALEISSNADIPSGTGLGSSSAFTVGLLHNFYVRNHQYVTKEQLAEEACDIEINRLNEPIGKQDQYASAVGGLNTFQFMPTGEVLSNSIHLRKPIYKELQSNLLLFYTGQQRSTSSILSEQKTNMKSSDKFGTMKQMVELVWKGRDALYEGELNEFGKLLDKSWALKRSIASKISYPEIDALYERALSAGALGGKLLGAGGGGFLLFYCEKQNQARLKNALQDLRHFQFRFENEGSKVIYVGDEYERN